MIVKIRRFLGSARWHAGTAIREKTMTFRIILCLALVPVFAQAAHAAVLDVGEGKPFRTPSAALARAKDGDTVRVAAGVYEDCATIKQNNLTLEGSAGEVTMRGKTCDGKAILIVKGSGVTIRGLTLANAKVENGNGAGIRAEGAALLVENTRFVDNENGILGANDPKVSIRVIDSVFIGNGQCRPDCAHGIYAGHSASLRVERSKFFRQNEGHHIKSRAAVTEIVECRIADGPLGTASALIDIPNGGTVLIERNEMLKGPMASNKANAIMISAEGEDNPKGPIVIRDNHFINAMGRGTTFVHNFGLAPVQMIGNVMIGDVIRLEGAGTDE
jgi:hypothetical protein